MKSLARRVEAVENVFPPFIVEEIKRVVGFPGREGGMSVEFMIRCDVDLFSMVYKECPENVGCGIQMRLRDSLHYINNSDVERFGIR